MWFSFLICSVQWACWLCWTKRASSLEPTTSLLLVKMKYKCNDDRLCYVLLSTFIVSVKFHGNFQTLRYYNKPKDGGPTFTILHYAGPVSCLIHIIALTSRNPLLFTTPQSSIIVVAFPLLYITGDLRDSGVSGEEQGHPQAGRVSVTENLREPHSPGPVPDSVVSHRRSVSGVHRQQGATECHSTLQSQGTSNGRYIIHHCKYRIILLLYPKC